MESEESEQLDKLLSSGQKTVAMFYADWCPFCKRFKPVFESVKSKYKKIQLKLNEDENPMWDKFAISAVPTVIAFEGNKIVARKDARMGIGLEKSDIDSLLQELNWN
ncbi:MAG TPA: thioredoxin family protein [Nitrososphaeraceae archaeon]|jgi:thioredoxin 1|nr:thioredoxin family protein [Nitrososphaeraceae archaeon]